ncbi:MAG: complex I NDUFA9 subunit family protein [Pseudomarimonas sp.]
MNNRHLVIFGGTGFVGTHLVPTLARAGWQVTVASRNAERLRQLAVLPAVRVVSVDVYDRAALVPLLRGARAAINLVGILNEPGRNGAGFRRAHVDLTNALIGACKEAAVSRLLQMSSLNAGRGTSHYLLTRGEAEQRVKSSELAWTLFQPSVIFGPDDGLFFRFAKLLALTPVLPLARANAKFAPVFVGDVVKAMLHALEHRDSIGQTYELYGPQVLTLREIVKYTAHHLGLRRFIVGLPPALGRLQAAVFDFVPGKPFSSDNWKSLQIDSVGGVDGLFRMGIPKTPIDAVMPTLLAGDERQARLDRCRALR